MESYIKILTLLYSEYSEIVWYMEGRQQTFIIHCMFVPGIFHSDITFDGVVIRDDVISRIKERERYFEGGQMQTIIFGKY